MQKVCRRYAVKKPYSCLTLSTYLVLQQLSLFQTNTKPLKPIVKTLNTFVETFSRQIVLVCRPPSFGRLSFRQIETFPE